MAIYHASAKIIKRSAGRSATAAAAYRAGSEIEDERTGEVHNYTRKGGVGHAEIIAPAGSPDWVQDRSRLWNAVELAENRKDAQVAREFEVSIPRELSPAQARQLVRSFVQEQFVSLGMIADICHHNEGGDNPHAHILLTMREIGPDGFGKKAREWNRTELLEQWRAEWAESANEALELAGHAARIDHRTLEAQGEDRTPQIHHANRPIRIERNEAIKAGNIERLVAKVAAAISAGKARVVGAVQAVQQAIRPSQTEPIPEPQQQPEIPSNDEYESEYSDEYESEYSDEYGESPDNAGPDTGPAPSAGPDGP